jgi:hypothetical protein
MRAVLQRVAFASVTDDIPRSVDGSGVSEISKVGRRPTNRVEVPRRTGSRYREGHLQIPCFSDGGLEASSSEGMADMIRVIVGWISSGQAPTCLGRGFRCANYRFETWCDQSHEPIRTNVPSAPHRDRDPGAPRDKLNLDSPVVVSSPPKSGRLDLYGGAFYIGDGSSYNNSTFVQRSVELGEPVIYANFNCRVNAFGWLAEGAANIGLHDLEYHLDDQRPSVVSDFLISLHCINPALTVRGSAREALPSLGRDLHFQVERRPENGYPVSFLSADLPPSPIAHSISHTIQLGSECKSSPHYRPPRHEPCQLFIQGCHPRISLRPGPVSAPLITLF